jgi:uncharacterized membrane protein
MTGFLIALAAFIAMHVGLSGSGLRAVLVGRIGERAYQGAFSLASVAVFAALIWTYGQARVDPAASTLWTPPQAALIVAHVLIIPGLLIGFTGILTPNPTAAGFENTVHGAEPARGVVRITRHPFLWGGVLWGLGHALANGETHAVLLGLGIAVMNLIGTGSIDAKRARRDPDDWARFARVTSNVPFAAIFEGRQSLKLGEMGWRPFAAAAIVAALYHFHAVLFGVPAHW